MKRGYAASHFWIQTNLCNTDSAIGGGNRLKRSEQPVAERLLLDSFLVLSFFLPSGSPAIPSWEPPGPLQHYLVVKASAMRDYLDN